MIQLYKLNEFQIKFQLKRMFIMLTFNANQTDLNLIKS